MKAFTIRNAMVALALIASFTLMPVRSNAQVKSTAAKVGFKAAKIEVVFHDAVKLADSIQKVGYRPDDDPAEFMKKYVTHLLTEAGVEVKDEAEEGVANITYYVGFDDADDDNDGTPDATDAHHFSGEAPDSVKDSEIEDVDVDAQSADARALPNPDKTKGIYVLVVNETDGTVEFYHQAEDVLGFYKQSGDGPTAAVPFSSLPHGQFESNHANLIRRPFYITYGSPLWSYMYASDKKIKLY
jgi:hypothetical protein